MAAGTGQQPLPAEPNHTRRFGLIWLVATLILLPIAIWVIGPIIPPGKASSAAAAQTTDLTVMLAMATPALTLVVAYLIYAIFAFRQPRGAALEGPHVRGDARVQMWWIIITGALVLALAGYGSARLLADNGEGSGSGPAPLTRPSGPKLPVQVIAQQWYFTYRWPTYGGVETPHLVLPNNTPVEFNVTSLDVIHSFWAIQLGVKADANPQVNNIAFATPQKEGPFEIRCAELCGLWHGGMFDTGRVVSPSAFRTWIRTQQVRFAPATKVLPPFSKTYQPEPSRRGE
jgi:cytochrome c oxidase subunit 2